MIQISSYVKLTFESRHIRTKTGNMYLVHPCTLNNTSFNGWKWYEMVKHNIFLKYIFFLNDLESSNWNNPWLIRGYFGYHVDLPSGFDLLGPLGWSMAIPLKMSHPKNPQGPSNGRVSLNLYDAGVFWGPQNRYLFEGSGVLGQEHI